MLGNRILSWVYCNLSDGLEFKDEGVRQFIEAWVLGRCWGIYLRPYLSSYICPRGKVRGNMSALSTCAYYYSEDFSFLFISPNHWASQEGKDTKAMELEMHWFPYGIDWTFKFHHTPHFTNVPKILREKVSMKSVVTVGQNGCQIWRVKCVSNTKACLRRHLLHCICRFGLFRFFFTIGPNPSHAAGIPLLIIHIS